MKEMSDKAVDSCDSQNGPLHAMYAINEMEKNWRTQVKTYSCVVFFLRVFTTNEDKVTSPYHW